MQRRIVVLEQAQRVQSRRETVRGLGKREYDKQKITEGISVHHCQFWTVL